MDVNKYRQDALFYFDNQIKSLQYFKGPHSKFERLSVSFFLVLLFLLLSYVTCFFYYDTIGLNYKHALIINKNITFSQSTYRYQAVVELAIDNNSYQLTDKITQCQVKDLCLEIINNLPPVNHTLPCFFNKFNNHIKLNHQLTTLEYFFCLLVLLFLIIINIILLIIIGFCIFTPSKEEQLIYYNDLKNKYLSQIV